MLTPIHLFLQQQLATSLESHVYAFPLITLSAFSFSALVTIIGLKRLRKMRKMGLGSSDRVGSKEMGRISHGGGAIGGGGGGGGGGGWREEMKRRSNSTMRRS